MTSYTGTSIENKPARLMRGEKLHKELHKIQTGESGFWQVRRVSKTNPARPVRTDVTPSELPIIQDVPTVQEVMKYLDKWLEYHNSKPCPNAREMPIKQVLNGVSKEKIDLAQLKDLMMKTETKTIHRNGIKFLGTHYNSDTLFGLREPVYVRYSLFDLSRVHVYTLKGEFLCVARQVTKTHPMAYHLGSVKDMEDFKQKIQKQKRLKNKAIKEYFKHWGIES